MEETRRTNHYGATTDYYAQMRPQSAWRGGSPRCEVDELQREGSCKRTHMSNQVVGNWHHLRHPHGLHLPPRRQRGPRFRACSAHPDRRPRPAWPQTPRAWQMEWNRGVHTHFVRCNAGYRPFLSLQPRISEP